MSSTSVRNNPIAMRWLSAVPIPDPKVEVGRERILLTGDLPSPQNPPSGLRVPHPMPEGAGRCAVEVPLRLRVSLGHRVACHFPAVRDVI